MLVYHDGVFDEAPFVPEEVRGRSGRGDTCTSAYLSRRLTAPPAEAVRWAAAVTSLKLEAEGPFRREMAEVEALYRSIVPRAVAASGSTAVPSPVVPGDLGRRGVLQTGTRPITARSTVPSQKTRRCPG